MRADQLLCCQFEDELAALIARQQSSREDLTRPSLFEALLDLEGRAKSGGASSLTLRKISEVRFLVGILRDAVRPFPVASLRMVLRACDPAAVRDGRRRPATADLDA